MTSLSVLVLGLLAPAAFAAPITLSHQVRVLDAAGAPVVGTHNVTLRLWTDATSTAPAALLWHRQYVGVTLEGGYASLVLGTDDAGVAVDSDWFGAASWVGVEVDAAGELAPRDALVSVPSSGFSQVAAHVPVVASLASTVCADTGAIVFDSATGGLQVCDGTAWVAQTFSNNGSSTASAGVSCNVLHADYPALPSALYWLDPDGSGGSAAFQAYCEMSGAYGGGWTLVAVARQNCWTNMRAAAGTFTSPSQATCAKLSDAQINALRTASGSDGVFWGWQDSTAYPMPAPRFMKIMTGEFNASAATSNLTQQCSCDPAGPWSAAYGYHADMAGVYNHSTVGGWECVAAGATGCTAASGASALFLYQHVLNQAGTFPSDSHSVPGGSNGTLYLR